MRQIPFAGFIWVGCVWSTHGSLAAAAVLARCVRIAHPAMESAAQP